MRDRPLHRLRLPAIAASALLAAAPAAADAPTSAPADATGAAPADATETTPAPTTSTTSTAPAVTTTDPAPEAEAPAPDPAPASDAAPAPRPPARRPGDHASGDVDHHARQAARRRSRRHRRRRRDRGRQGQGPHQAAGERAGRDHLHHADPGRARHDDDGPGALGAYGDLSIPAPIGVPNFFIEHFRIPPFLLSIYQAAGMQYGVRWEVLAAINEIETDYGRNLNVSSAGAVGWMQFMPATWSQWGVDANHDGRKDPFNPADAIFAAARYLRAAGAETDVRRAVFAYNHADWYVDSVLMRARLIGGLPSDLVGSLTGLTQGRFPVYGKRATPAISTTRAPTASPRATTPRWRWSPPARGARSSSTPRRAAPPSPCRTARIVRIGTSERLGRYVQLRDVYGNTLHLRPPRDRRQALPRARPPQRHQRRRSPASSTCRTRTPSRPHQPARVARSPGRRRRPGRRTTRATSRRQADRPGVSCSRRRPS